MNGGDDFSAKQFSYNPSQEDEDRIAAAETQREIREDDERQAEARKCYLGDGVYAEIGPLGVTLTTRRMENGLNWIVLGPSEFKALSEFLERQG